MFYNSDKFPQLISFGYQIANRTDYDLLDKVRESCPKIRKLKIKFISDEDINCDVIKKISLFPGLEKLSFEQLPNLNNFIELS